MKNEFVRGPLSRITVWSGQDGPIPLEGRSVGVEYRGRIGHPSSYGLLAGELLLDTAKTALDIRTGKIGGVSPPLFGDRLIDGMSEPEYEMAIRKAAQQLGLSVTVALAAEISSSQVVFSRLAIVLRAVLDSPDLMMTAAQIWKCWDGVS
jgi:hypothetical protein